MTRQPALGAPRSSHPLGWTGAALAVVLVGGCGGPSPEAGRPQAAPGPRASLIDHANADEDGPVEPGPEAASEVSQAPAGGAEPGVRGAAPAAAAGAASEAEARIVWTCTRETFPILLPLAEASGASYVSDPAGPYLLVVGDSGNRGQYVELDPETGAVVATGHLPLGHGASDDLEGLSVRGEVVYGITSAGWMRHWRRRPGRDGDERYQLVRGPYPIAPRVALGLDLRCDSARDINCARNYEGLCLRDPTDDSAACAGFAVSKADGALYCLSFDGRGDLEVTRRGNRPVGTIAVAAGDTLTGCHFAPDAATGQGVGRVPDVVWVGSNASAANRVFTVSGWQNPARARVDTVGALGTGFDEALAVGPGGRLYRFSDTSSATSLADKFVCR
ncbi:hypothetical protein [Haliangium sp.]|uniref:hypothetical protein n=1 Tax=Haliangium sp. TaxID=2663208 RepID=UPI003D11C4B6